jgi:threonine dehydrogenase-like Zn-dependent dehydrogenase
MRAMAVEPGRAGSATLVELETPVGDGEVLVDGLAVGICGTDREIAEGHYGQPPPGERLLVIGHESVGRVRSAPATSGLVAGDLVVGIVRRPDPVPCRPCSMGAWDMCRNGRYTERGIKQLHGYGAQQWRVEADFCVRVDPALGDLATLVEPASVVAKAWDHIAHIAARAPIAPRRVLVTGAGPVGLLAALLAIQRGFEVHVLDRVTDGPKPDLVRALGAAYHATAVDTIPEPDLVIECTGAPSVVLAVIQRSAPAGIVCLTGVSSGARTLEVDIGATNRTIVLENDVIFGSVNANRSHYEAAAHALAAADHDWLRRMVTSRVPLTSWTDALQRRPDDVKAIIDLSGAL